MERASIRVKSGSAPGVFYEIAIEKTGAEVRVQCSCPAGDNGMLCKHVLAAGQGDGAMLTEGEEKEWERWHALFAGSAQERHLRAWLEESAALEDQIAKLQQQAKKLKKQLGRILLGV